MFICQKHRKSANEFVTNSQISCKLHKWKPATTNTHISSFATDLQYSASSRFHQSHCQWILLPTFCPVIQLCKSISSALGFPWGKNCINLSIFFPPVFLCSACPHFVEKLYPCGDQLGLEVRFQEAFVFPIPFSARSSTAMRAVLGISQSSQCHCSTSRAGDFRRGSQAGFLNHPPGAAGASAGSRCFLSFSPAELEGAVTPLRTEQSTALQSPGTLHSPRIEFPAWGRLEEAEVFSLLVGPFSLVALQALICKWNLKRERAPQRGRIQVSLQLCYFALLVTSVWWLFQSS